MRAVKGIIAVGVFCAGYPTVTAQSINVDLDISSGPGSGAPSSAFGGAANSPGYWNSIDAGGPNTPVGLAGLDGNMTNVQLVATGGDGSSGGYRNVDNTGDFALLLNDAVEVGGEVDYHLSGFQPGRYEIVTYAVGPYPMTDVATVTVPGADNPVQTVTGPMPGNQFILGVTHSIHYLSLAGDAFQIQVSGPWPNTYCNGFQIVAVPEPGTALFFGAGVVALLLRRKRR